MQRLSEWRSLFGLIALAVLNKLFKDAQTSLATRRVFAKDMLKNNPFLYSGLETHQVDKDVCQGLQ